MGAQVNQKSEVHCSDEVTNFCSAHPIAAYQDCQRDVGKKYIWRTWERCGSGFGGAKICRADWTCTEPLSFCFGTKHDAGCSWPVRSTFLLDLIMGVCPDCGDKSHFKYTRKQGYESKHTEEERKEATSQFGLKAANEIGAKIGGGKIPAEVSGKTTVTGETMWKEVEFKFTSAVVTTTVSEEREFYFTKNKGHGLYVYQA